MGDANHFVTLWNGEFPEEDPPGMEWNADKTSLTISCDKSTSKIIVIVERLVSSVYIS